MYSDTLQDIDKIVVGIDIMKLASGEQALDDADVLRTELSPVKQPIALAHSDRAYLSFKMVGVDSDIGVTEKDF